MWSIEIKKTPSITGMITEGVLWEYSVGVWCFVHFLGWSRHACNRHFPDTSHDAYCYFYHFCTWLCIAVWNETCSFMQGGGGGLGTLGSVKPFKKGGFIVNTLYETAIVIIICVATIFMYPSLRVCYIWQQFIHSVLLLNLYENRILDIYLQDCNALMENLQKVFYMYIYEHIVYHNFCKIQSYLINKIN